VSTRPQIPEVAALAVTDDMFVLDVREPDEWTAGHVSCAVHVPMMEVPSRCDEVPRDRDVVVVCRVGGRSAQVVAYLQAHGWHRAANLAGGMFAWQEAGRPVVGDDGQPGRVV
jgi:rhodanese-related sulfurtransferase